MLSTWLKWVRTFLAPYASMTFKIQDMGPIDARRRVEKLMENTMHQHHNQGPKVVGIETATTKETN